MQRFHIWTSWTQEKFMNPLLFGTQMIPSRTTRRNMIRSNNSESRSRMNADSLNALIEKTCSKNSIKASEYPSLFPMSMVMTWSEQWFQAFLKIGLFAMSSLFQMVKKETWLRRSKLTMIKIQNSHFSKSILNLKMKMSSHKLVN